MGKRFTFAIVLAGLLVPVAGSTGAGGAGTTAGASARAFAIRVVVPGQPGAEVGSISAPPAHVAFGSSFAYPADGSVVSAGSLTASASSDSGTSALAEASTEVQSLKVFGDEITASSVIGEARGSTRGRSARGDFSGAGVSDLAVLGQATPVAPNGRVALADWGYLVTLEQGTEVTSRVKGAQRFHGFVTALAIHVTAPHGGLPAGSEIQIGYAESTVQAALAQPARVQPDAKKAKKKNRTGKSRHAPEPSRNGGTGVPLLPIPSGLQPRLTAGGYVFPVYGPASFVNTYGAFRGDVAGNWHHGDDIFAPLGAPLLACADGTVFSVGWNDVGGNRLWLRDGQGNEFYYAHLSAFTPLAKNGRRVKAGEVLGFVGNTGDAQGTPPHLHFEIHPFSLLFMDYDGAVDPTAYLHAWRRLQDVRFLPVAGWIPTVITDPAPKPAAILLQVSDISEASGLDPGSLRRAMAARAGRGTEAQLLRSLGFRSAAGARP